MWYLLKTLWLILISYLVIYKYYEAWLHKESFNNYLSYLISIIIIYWIYKFITIKFSKNKLSFSLLQIIWFCILQLLVLCFIFFEISWWWQWALQLFFKIIFYLILPFLITIISYSFAEKILSYINWFEKENNIFKFNISLWLWFGFFLITLTIAWILWFYNFWSVLIILWCFIWFSFKELINNFINLYTFKIELPNHNLKWDLFEQINLYLLSTEFLFIFINFLIWVNLINVVRPMPIWWDDLWAYMNIPQIMANSWKIIEWIWLTTWQTLTGIWYMFHSAPQAFFLNQLWWILTIICIITTLSYLFKSNKKIFLNIPLLWAAIIYSMPMIIFQQAKDMKLDPWLFFISIIWIFILIYLSLKYIWYENDYIEDKEKNIVNTNNIFFTKFNSIFKLWWNLELFNKKEYLIYFFILWIIVWLAFSIKLTTLMLILAFIWVIAYINIWLSWFLAFFTLFIWIFTKFKLWDFLNVNYPKENIDFINSVWLICVWIFIFLLIYIFFKYKSESIKKTFLLSIIFLLWIFTFCLPLFVKNIIENDFKISISWILNWKQINNFTDYSKIYNKNILEEIEKKFKTESMSSSGKTTNEDLWRYFWYENGINNYLKLPINLTLQSNQPWEYTEITYIFLALIPIVFIFLNFKNNFLIIWILLFILFEFLYFIFPISSNIITNFFSKIILPNWYIVILWILLLPLIYFLYWLKNDKISQIFKLNLVLSTTYTFLFIISAFGIVWYWIAMYFLFIIMIFCWWFYLIKKAEEEIKKELKKDKKEEEEEIEKLFKNNFFKFIWSASLLFIISLYFLNSSYPHWFNNLAWASFKEFKAWFLNQEEAIFNSHSDYFNILSHLNISDQDKLYNNIITNIKNNELKKIINDNLWNKPTIENLFLILNEIINSNQIAFTIKTESKIILNKLYKEILYPSSNLQNNSWIYRIGTFLTYFISNNRTRYYDDSLIFQFDKYFYDKNPDVTIERMKKMWLKYLLVDLNAATIDKDPRHDLTKRFENLLKTFKSSKLQLIQTDSICLKIALEENLNEKDYLYKAWVNYESYENWNVINRKEKLFNCYNHILKLMQENKITDSNYTYLKPYLNYLKTNIPKNEKELANFFTNNISHWWLVLFKIN